MERTIIYKTDAVTPGVIYNEKNEVIKSGWFVIKNDKNNQLTLKNIQDDSIITCNKKDFDQGDLIPRRISITDLLKEKKIEALKEERLINKKKDISEEDIKEAQQKIKQRKQDIFTEKEDNIKKFIPITKEIVKITDETQIINLINSGIKNIWLVGPSGCGKTTISKIVAKMLHKPFLLLSLGEGTSPSEFKGRHFPQKESTPFCEYYRKPAIIVLDEFTTLIPETAQVLNAALANDFIYTTTGKVYRHADCIIIATSNTYGTGSDTMYLANNSLDASTIDRFTGGIISLNYSKSYESQYDKEVVNYVNVLRETIGQNYLKRIASTRMIITGEKLKKNGHSDWKERLIINWTKEEQELVLLFEKEQKEKRIQAAKDFIKNILSENTKSDQNVEEVEEPKRTRF